MNPQAATVGTPTPTTQQHGLLGVPFAWAQQAFQIQGSARTWLLVLMILVIFGWFWNHILLMLIDEI